jgi:hypothetical protein
MYESRPVRLLHAFALAAAILSWLSSTWAVVAALSSPQVRAVAPPLAASTLLLAAVVVPLCLLRLVTVLRGTGLRRVPAAAPVARALRWLGLGVMAFAVLSALAVTVLALAAAALPGGGALLLGVAVVKPFTGIVTPLTGVLLFESSRLLALEEKLRAVTP